MDFDLPQLAIGSHDRGSGYACVMNALSYLKGDKKITDYPTCVDPLLARVAQVLNDKICRHTAERHTTTPNPTTGAPMPETVTVLCSSCAHQVWLYGAELMGTGEHWGSPLRGIEDAARDVAERQWSAWLTVVEGHAANSGRLERGTARTLFRRIMDHLRHVNTEGGVADLDLLLTARSQDLISLPQYEMLRELVTGILFPYSTMLLDRNVDAAQMMHNIAGNLVGILWRTSDPKSGHRYQLWARSILDRWKRVTDYRGEPLVLSPETAAKVHEAMAAAPAMTGVYEAV